MLILLSVFAMLIPLIPAVVFFARKNVLDQQHEVMTKRVVIGLTAVDVVVGLMILLVGAVWLLSPETVQAAGLAQTTTTDPYRTLAAAIAVSVGSLSAGYAVSTTGSAALGAISEKPEVFGRALIFVGLAEGVAIYGLIIAFIILGG